MFSIVYLKSNRVFLLCSDGKKMTKAKLAEIVGVTRQTIMAIENAKYAPSLELAFLIAAAFGVPIQDVFSYKLSL